MDLMQMAGHLSLAHGVAVEGPFRGSDSETVLMWLPNKRGIVLTHKEGRDAPHTAELGVIRETIPAPYTEYNATPYRFDYSTPITADVVPGRDATYASLALHVLKGLPEIDPRDQRSTRQTY